MKRKTDYYPYYKKLTKMTLEKPPEEADEYKVLFQNYPCIAESIKLKTEMKRLNEKMKSVKDRPTKFQIKREMNKIKAMLKREGILKQLHGESKQEKVFKRRFRIDSMKEHVSFSIMRTRKSLTKVSVNAQKRLRASAHRNLPPPIFDLNSLDMAEKGLALREWIRRHRKQSSVVSSVY